MKKFVSGIFVLLLLVCCGLFYGCGERYSGLTFSMELVHTSNPETLENGDLRIVGSEGTFDDHRDGSYTLYIDKSKSSSVTFQIEFSGVPDDFNYGVSFSLSNEILKISDSTVHTSNGIKKTITAFDTGTTILTAHSNEGGKSASIVINVVRVAESISFVNDNLAITNKINSKLDLNQSEVLKLYPEKSNITKVSYSFSLQGGDNFEPLNENQMLDYGLRFNQRTQVIDVIKQNVSLDKFFVRASYENPLDSEKPLTDEIEVKVVSVIENLQFFLGKTKDDIVTGNKISENDVQNLIINIEDMNYIDLIVLVDSNGEKVEFNYVHETIIPVYFNLNQNDYEYLSGQVTNRSDSLSYSSLDSNQTLWGNAKFTAYFVKVIATKKTTENDNYQNGEYNLKFNCDYSNYFVDGYPLVQAVKIKNDTLVRNFSVNNEELENASIVENRAMQGYYDAEVYINNDLRAVGTSLKVDVASPVNILNQNARFKVAFYNSDFDQIERNIDYKFKAQKATGNNADLVNITDDFASIFERNTSFYLKANPKTASNPNGVSIGEVYYMVLTAVMPEGTKFADKRANATIKITIVQGISEFTGYSYEYDSYKVDEATGLYETDADGNKIIVQKTESDLTFDAETFIGTTTIFLDLESQSEAKVTLDYEPAGASLNNITIVSDDTDVADVKRLPDLNTFNIVPKSIGEVTISISTTNLATIYYIKANIYRPITGFNVNLASTTTSYGVGGYELSADNSSVVAAEIKIGKKINLNLTTLPSTANQYSLDYALYKGIVDEANLIGTYSIDYAGKTSSEIYMIGNDEFQLDCKQNSFVFIKDECAGDIYTVTIKLTNLDGSYWSHEIALKGYVPVEKIDTYLTKYSLYNPNTIAYVEKDLSENDPTVFGMKVEINKTSGRIATYNFENCGKIIVFVNGVNENEMTLRNGLLTVSNPNSLVLPIYTLADDDGYYWFKLNEGYNYKNLISSVYLSVRIKEINYDFIDNSFVDVLNAETVSSLRTNSEERLYFKQGITESSNIEISVSKDSAYNKNLFVKSYDILEVEDTSTADEDDVITYYIDTSETTGVISNLAITETSLSNKFNLSFTPNSAGMSVIIVLPQDKIITSEQNDLWFEQNYVSVDISENEFVSNMFYYYESEDYILAETYEEGKEYFALTTNLDSIHLLWEDFLAIYVTVADGIKQPYQISTAQDFYEIGLSGDSVTKKYVLTKDIALDSSKNLQPIGAYYKVDGVTQENFYNGVYYIYNEESETFEKYENWVEGDEEKEFYSFGFNGNLSGKYTYRNVHTGKYIPYYYQISNLTYVGVLNADENGFGLITEIGLSGKIDNLKLNYNYFQPTVNGSLLFGGLAASNRGEVKNIQINFQNFVLNVEDDSIVGGLIGNNYGELKNNEVTSTGLTGLIKVYLKTVDAEYSIGGLVGYNYEYISGSFNTEEEIKYTFNSAGFDSSLNIEIGNATGNAENKFINTSIGGAVGTNKGHIKNLSLQGKVYAPDCKNVGGLVGTSLYNEKFNAENVYSIESSYSIATIEGYDYVGGAIGKVDGDEGTIYIYNISAENYVTDTNTYRTFVTGFSSTGGLIGYAKKTKIYYSYVVSYFDCDVNSDEAENNYNYDIVSSEGTSGGFIASTDDVSIYNCAVNANVKGKTFVAPFVATPTACSIENSFVISCIYSGDNCQTNISGNILGYVYSVVRVNSPTITDHIYYYDSLGNDTLDELLTVDVSSYYGWDKDEQINNNLPYLTIEIGGKEQVLFATTPIIITANVFENNDVYEFYIKNDTDETDTSLILYYNYDYLSKYPAEDIKNLNIVSVTRNEKGLKYFAKLQVIAETHKTAKLNISTSAANVIAINSDGSLRIVGEGKAILTISSKLNKNYKVEIHIVVKYGLTDVNLYGNIALTNDLQNGSTTIKILKSKNQTLYLETLYNRDLQTKNNAELKSLNSVTTRFLVEDDANLQAILANIDGKNTNYTINDLFKFNGLTWLYNGGQFYVDVPAGTNPIINPIRAMDEDYRNLVISYVPLIKENFRNLDSEILLTSFAGQFTLSIIKGATSIIFENNIENKIEVSQLQTQTFTVTLFTDYELDNINDTIDLENLNNGSMLTVVKSDLVKRYRDADNLVLESISITYTINYKDKMNAVENDLIYNFEFSAISNIDIKTSLQFVIQGQDKINQVYGTIYANLTDFPQQPEKSNIIYNANVGVLSVEVYPFFSNYSRMRVFYQTSSTHPLVMTQLSYNISGEAGKLLTNYPESGSIMDSSGYMLVEKSSGQDTYLLNSLGTYSYSKIYFFSLLAASDVPDNTEYSIFVQFLNRQNIIIETVEFKFTTIALPSVNFSFDQSLKSLDDTYYLPLNTENEIKVDLVNYDGDITWEITSEYDLAQNEIDVLTPKLNEKGVYTMRILRYTSATASDNVFDTSLNILGQKLKITAYITDGQRTYSSSQEIIVSLFTVKDVKVQNVVNGYMTLPMSTTSPLQVSLDVHYDENLINNADNWYAEWYKKHEQSLDTTNTLFKYLTACGYEIEQNFAGYISQLMNAISKVQNDYSDTSETKTSGIWFYKEGDNSGYLQTNRDYNNSTFGVELYNDFFAVYGFQIDTNSSMAIKLNLSYTNNEGIATKLVDAKGIPNVYNHNISVTNVTYKTDFLLEKDFILTFVYKSDLINAIPVSTPEEFLEMKEGFDYRLTNDIILSDYTPISTAISSFDGNNYNIYITSFSYTSEDKGECVLGLFNEVNKNTMLYNVSVVYTNKVEIIKGENVPDVIGLNSNLTNASVVKFGGIAGRNNGTLTNCTVSGKVNLTLNIDVNAGTVAEALNGGLVAINSETGYITNSTVENFNFNGYGVTGGFVGENSGKIVSSYFDSSSINNLSSNDTAGFVYLNSGYIYESYVQGYRLSTDVDIRNTGAGVVSKGTIGGFVHTNQKVISDCYANISLSSSIYIAGFIYQDTSESVISRSYSISYKSASDNSTVASPFAGANSANYTKVTINGVLNNCYYLNIAGWSKLTWDSDLPTKQAGGLTLDEFATHTNFVNYDLSLEYKQGYYADSTTLYDYADGYIWVIIEGKPVIVSTLIDTISQCDYKGKTKDYSSTFAYYDAAKYTKIEVVEVAVGTDKVRVSYYDNSKDVPVDELTEDELIFYTMQDNTKLTINYYFMPKGDNEAITLTYKITELENGKIKTKEILSAEYGTNEKKILDTRDKNESGYIEDKNFRANDTIEISYDENGLVNYINYKVLESASYYYASNALNVSHVVGSRTNPQIIYDYKSFVYYTSQNNAGKFFRVIRDIDFGYQFTPTAYKTFQGAIQGNYMEFDNISISFLNNSQENEDDKHVNVTSFGLFATISTINTFVVSDDFDTIISNLKLNIIEVLSNTHKFVGGLAGQITADQTLSNRNVVLSNITIGGMEGDAAYIQGKNAVGGLAGIATGNVIIKDITCSVNVNASKEINNGDASKLLYDKNNANPVDNVAYAGAVIGIFDTNIIDDPSTERDYNANNITVNGEISIIGGIVGSAFGMVGKTTVVNYVNTVIKNSNKNYLRATAYAGGLVGENRGQIISSSIGYGELETYSSVGIGTSSLISTNYFYNGYSSNSVIAIGGLVGLNNGGTISNSISSVDVRNKNATIAGGAVGRMIQGSLINVISSGSVLSKSIVGGFIGVLNDYNMILSAGYKSNSIVRVEDEINPTVITNCVSAANWMVKDYTYFMGLINAGYPVAGFIGLISYSSSTGNINFIKFEGSNYFTNTLYTSTNSNVPQYYLKVAFKSESFDLVTNFDEAYIESLNGIDGKQAVHPYSIREMYYEDTFVGANYEIRTSSNPAYNVQSSNGPFAKYIYTIVSATDNIKNLYANPTDEETEYNGLFREIDFSDNTMLGGSWSGGTHDYDFYKDHFGKFYVYKDDEFSEVTSKSSFESYVAAHNKFYFIESPILKQYLLTKTYLTSERHDINIDHTKTLSGNKYDNVTLTVLDDFNKIDSIYINGLLIKNLPIKATATDNYTSFVDDKGISTRLYEYELNNFLLPNGVQIEAIRYAVVPKVVKANDDEELTYYTISYVDLDLVYDIDGSYIDSVTTKVSNSEVIYDLSVSSKKVIYNNFIDNGYWETKDNFLLDGDYEKAQKYLINLELAETYFWSSFAGNNVYETDADGNVYISTAEQFAYFANQVNGGNNFNGKTVTLTADIDLSGKYWIPIGLKNSTNYMFKGNFTGKHWVGDLNKNGVKDEDEYVIHTIKYATVSEQHKDLIYGKYSIPSSTEFAVGIFGYLGQDAKITDLNIMGGDVSGDYAGGLVGYAGKTGTIINNVVNRNNVSGNIYAGGIVGFGNDISITNSINYASVEHNNVSADAKGFGGIIGAAKSLTLTNCENEGVISVFNNKVSYSGTKSKTNISVGGLVGRVDSISVVGNNNNIGNISISSNAHTLNVGGVIGYSKTNASGSIILENLKNYSDITVNYTNIFSSGNNDKHYANAFVGGVVGCLENNLRMCGNEGKISFTITTTSDCFVGIGGIAGVLRGETRDSRNAITNNYSRTISQSYNTNNIDMSTISSKTKIALGGICGYSDVTVSNNTIENCYNSGDLQTDSNSTIYAGGILGTSVYDTNKFEGTPEVRTERYYVFALEEPEKFTKVKKCLDIGYVNITNYNKSINAIGAILGYFNNLVNIESTDYNYYLKDAAYSGTTIYTGYSTSYTEGENDYFVKAGSDVLIGSDIVKIEEVGCKARLVSTLKTISSYGGVWTFTKNPTGSGSWIQAYDTWFPSIDGNISSSMWSDKQEAVSQEKGSFIVSTPEELAYLATMINSGEIDSSGITIKLTDFIDLANRYWIPIGTNEEPFKGTFDGNGYVIRNLTIDGSITTDYNYGGLFGVIENATIKNVGLEAPIIKNVDYAGAIAYKATNSVISMVYTDTGKDSKDAGVVAKTVAGGLIGIAKNCKPLDGNNNKGGIYTSYNNIPVEITGSYVADSSYAAGLVGKMEATLIKNSYNNDKGVVTTTQTISEGQNSQILITNYADRDCDIVNTFSLYTGIIKTGANEFNCEPKMFKIETIEDEDEANITAGNSPTYEELLKGDENAKEIWTEEYTLNETDYPSIRGLGQEWKNTESEALINYRKEEIEVEAQKIVADLCEDDAINGENDYTLVHLYKNKTTEVETTAKSYYLITTAEELAWVATNVNSGNLLTNNCEFILLKDIDLSGKYWTPIGANYVYPFQGIFNFNGHTINGLTIDSSSLIHGGLFGYTKGAKIINGYLTNVFVKLKYDDIKTNIYVGAVAGKGYNTTIENISVDATLGAFSSSGAFVGGIIGSLTGTQNYSISNVRVNKTQTPRGDSYIDLANYYYQVVEKRNANKEEVGIIRSKSIAIGGFSNGGNVYAGGIVGYISGYDLVDSPNEYLLNAAYNECNVAAVTTSNASNAYLGGIVGYALEEVKLNNIQNSGNLKSYAEKIDMIGGLVGYINNGNIQNGYFDGYMEACLINNTLSYIGGIVAYMQTQGYIRHTVNNGSIQGCEKYDNDANIGSIIGFSTDRTFNEDKMSIYSTSNGFTYKAVGIDDQNNDPLIVNSKFSTDLTYINSQNEFDSILWKNRLLNCKMVYVVGCGVSFSTVSVDTVTTTVSLSGTGKLGINMNDFILKAENDAIGTDPKIGIAIRNNSGQYKYFEKALANTTNINLGSALLGSGMSDDCIVCYVTLIANLEP